MHTSCRGAWACVRACLPVTVSVSVSLSLCACWRVYVCMGVCGQRMVVCGAVGRAGCKPEQPLRGSNRQHLRRVRPAARPRRPSTCRPRSAVDICCCDRQQGMKGPVAHTASRVVTVGDPAAPPTNTIRTHKYTLITFLPKNLFGVHPHREHLTSRGQLVGCVCCGAASTQSNSAGWPTCTFCSSPSFRFAGRSLAPPTPRMCGNIGCIFAGMHGLVADEQVLDPASPGWSPCVVHDQGGCGGRQAVRALPMHRGFA